METAPAAVYQAISLVQEELAKIGIAKTRQNQQQGYSYRGIDEVYNELSPLLAKHKLCILPRVLDRTISERSNKNGTAIFSVAVACEFDFVCAEDGSKHTVKTYGEAMDSGDKATNKAMSAAFKYACMQAFCIPTAGDNDVEATTHEVAAIRSNTQSSKSTTTAKPAGTYPGQPLTAEKATEYHERIRVALRGIFGDDREAALNHVEKTSAWIDKETGEMKAPGVRDYRRLSPKRLQILCHRLEEECKTAKKATPVTEQIENGTTTDDDDDIIPV